MDFSLTEEQAMLADSIARFIETDYDFETRQKIAAGEGGFSKDMWRTFAELGWTAVPFSDEDGGLDGGPVELMLMMQEFGRGLLVEPFLANIVLAGGALRRFGQHEPENQMDEPSNCRRTSGRPRVCGTPGSIRLCEYCDYRERKVVTAIF